MFAHPGYRRLWTARTASQAGDVFNTVALSLLVLQLTGSGLGVSAVVLAEILPVLALAPLAGTLADRFPRVRLMIGADLLRAGLAGALPFVAGNAVAVYAVAFGMSVGAVVFNPAANATLPALVDDQELVAANSGIWTAAVLSQIALAPARRAARAHRRTGAGVRYQRRHLPVQCRHPHPAATPDTRHPPHHRHRSARLDRRRHCGGADHH